MPKLFSVASWNVEHFKGSDDPNHSQRCTRVINFLNEHEPDVFGMYEVEGKEVFRDITTKMPNYTFHITEGPQVQEILVGVKTGITSFFTQKITFKTGVNSLRPGALLTLTIQGKYYSILFLHAKSATNPRSFGLRDDIIYRSLKFAKVLDKVSPNNQANYIVLGDLNTMGMKVPNLREKDISAAQEIKRIKERAKRYYDLDLLSKTFDTTWSNGSNSSYPDSNLDHVLAAEHLKFTEFEKNGQKGFVDVKGWVDAPDIAAKDKWIEDYSDHSLLYFEVVE